MTRPVVTGRVASLVAGLLRTRWIVRVPVWLYRARLGAIFGSRLILLEHRGRTSGTHRYAVLEVVARSAPDTILVASGFGDRAQWYRNIAADPAVRVTQGSRRPRAARARMLSQADSTEVLARYAGAHPRAWRGIRPVLETTLGAAIDEHSATPMVAFDLQ